jgi:hypothetical protein
MSHLCYVAGDGSFFKTYRLTLQTTEITFHCVTFSDFVFTIMYMFSFGTYYYVIFLGQCRVRLYSGMKRSAPENNGKLLTYNA